MLLVFGATGHVGGELVSLLSSRGIETRAVTRDLRRAPSLPAVRWAEADLGDPASLGELFTGARRIFLLTGNSPSMAELQMNAIQAARAAGVESIVKQSALGASDHSRSPIGRAHHAVEKELIASGLGWTILRPHVFMQNLLDQASSIAQEGRVSAASGDGRVPFIDAADIAAVAAAVLTQPGHESQKYALTGPEALSYHDVARVISEVTGRSVAYLAERPDEARDRMIRAGASSWDIESALALAEYQRAGGPTAEVHDTVERILGRPARSFAEFAKANATAFRNPLRPEGGSGGRVFA